MDTELKLVLIVALLAGVFWAGWHLGGLSSKSALEGYEATQAQDTAKAVLAERASNEAELAKRDAVIKGYENAPIDPIVTTAAHRVYVYASAAGCPLPQAAAVAGGADAPAAVPASPGAVERALDEYIKACDSDARRLAALQALSP